MYKNNYLAIFCLYIFLLAETIYAKTNKNSDYAISDGNRIFFKNKKFNIIPTWGWAIDKTSLKNGLVLLSPEKTKTYHANIQIIRFNDAINIRTLSRKDIYNKYIRSYINSNPQVKNLYMHETSILNFQKDHAGLTFYTSFKLDKTEMMQVYLIISSVNNHFILCFTDIAKHFGDQDIAGYFDDAWDAMASIKLSDDIYKPFITTKLIIVMLSILTLIIALIGLKKIIIK